MNEYDEMKKRHSKEFGEFPLFFAFTDKDFKDGMEKLGLKENEENKLCSIGLGGFIREKDIEKFEKMQERHRNEIQMAIKNDLTGKGFIKDMFESELANHEYGYTYELTDTLVSLGLSYDDINKKENIRNGLDLALKRYKEEYEEEELEE